jgi:ATP-dependent RNA helicase RhlE
VPNVPDDYVHRIGRTARMDAEGDAFVLVAPAEEKSLALIERQIGQRLPRVTLPDFDYASAPPERGSRPGHRSRGEQSRSGRPGPPSSQGRSSNRSGRGGRH